MVADNVEIVSLLLDRGADPNQTDQDGNTALSLIVNWNKGDKATLLLRRGADPNHKNKDGDTPLHLALAILELIDIEGPYLWCCNREACEMVKQLLDSGADPNLANQKGETALMRAAQRTYVPFFYTNVHDYDDGDAAALLLDRGADPNMEDESRFTALEHAILRGSERVVRLLLDKGVDPNHASRGGETALILSAYRIESRVDSNPLAHERAVGIAALLLARGADPHIVDKHGRTAMDYSGRVSELVDIALRPVKSARGGERPTLPV